MPRQMKFLIWALAMCCWSAGAWSGIAVSDVSWVSIKWHQPGCAAALARERFGIHTASLMAEMYGHEPEPDGPAASPTGERTQGLPTQGRVLPWGLNSAMPVEMGFSWFPRERVFLGGIEFQATALASLGLLVQSDDVPRDVDGVRIFPTAEGVWGVQADWLAGAKGGDLVLDLLAALPLSPPVSTKMSCGDPGSPLQDLHAVVDLNLDLARRSITPLVAHWTLAQIRQAPPTGMMNRSTLALARMLQEMEALPGHIVFTAALHDNLLVLTGGPGAGAADHAPQRSGDDLVKLTGHGAALMTAARILSLLGMALDLPLPMVRILEDGAEQVLKQRSAAHVEWVLMPGTDKGWSLRADNNHGGHESEGVHLVFRGVEIRHGEVDGDPWWSVSLTPRAVAGMFALIADTSHHFEEDRPR